jgi:hypothetical protein
MTSKMSKMLKPPQVGIFDIFAKVAEGVQHLREGAHPEHLRLTNYYYERKEEREPRRCSPHRGLRARARGWDRKRPLKSPRLTLGPTRSSSRAGGPWRVGGFSG